MQNAKTTSRVAPRGLHSEIMDDIDIAPPVGAPPLLPDDQVRQLCDHGYVGVVLPTELSYNADRLFQSAAAFFDMPIEEKLRFFPPSPNSTEQGYTHLPGEKEFVTLRHRTCQPRNVGSSSESSISSTAPHAQGAGSSTTLASHLENLMSLVWTDASRLLHRILTDVGARLGNVAPDAWDPLVADAWDVPPSPLEAGPSMLRVFRYEPRGGVADPHRDLGLLTLCICRGYGLEVWQRPGQGLSGSTMHDRDDSSHPLNAEMEARLPDHLHPHVKNTLQGPEEGNKTNIASSDGTTHSPPVATWKSAPSVTVLVGDTLSILSGRRIPAGRHRVVSSEDGRMSIVFALRATTRGTIELGPFGGSGAVDADALWQAISTRRVNVNVRKEIREKQRALSRANK
ncbi:hypothetical protein VTK73DRAFT_799 [Phialemonium thermophilum]|uniref:Fe2OG dioxygenase domain-containing protein n=1 Tax=Phialemonium thermophilum TaxID=223376 RepID=A0ABR3XD54_9PEZI